MERRRKFNPEEKLQIALEGITNENGISEVGRRHGISPTQYCTRRRRLMSSAGDVLNSKPGKKEAAKIEHLEEELKRKDAVIAEITEENPDLKKGRWTWSKATR